MLQKMRDNTQSLGFKILVGAIIFVLAVFGFGAFNLFLDPDPAVASVNGEDITQRQLANETERARQRLLGQLGEGADPSVIDSLNLQGQVLEQLINRELMNQTTEDLGLMTSKSRVDQVLLDNPQFQVDGTFNADVYRRILNQMGYEPPTFAALISEEMAVAQLQDSVTESSVVPPWQLRWLVSLLRQQRDIAYLPLEQATFAERAEVSEEEVSARYADNQALYLTEEAADVAFVELSWQSFLETAQADVTEDDLIAAYEAEKEEAASGEQRRSSHILLRVDDDRTEEQALALAAELRSSLAEGADFAELVAEHSDDPGSAASGGDLGLAGKGVFVPPFEEALFALEEGELSQPVVSQFGVHVIRLDEIVVPEYPSLDERREELTTQVAENEARNLFREALSEFDSIAFEQNHTLDGLIEGFDVTQGAAGNVTRTTGEGILAEAALREAVFSREVFDDGFNSAAIELDDDRAVVLRVTERHDPRQQTLEEVRASIEAELRAEQAQIAITEAVSDGITRLEAGEDTGTIADDLALEWQVVAGATRNNPGVPSEVLRVAFETAPPAPGSKRVVTADLPGGGQALVTVTGVRNGDIEALTAEEIDGVSGFLGNRTSNLEFNGLFDSVRRDASIRRQDGA